MTDPPVYGTEQYSTSDPATDPLEPAAIRFYRLVGLALAIASTSAAAAIGWAIWRTFS